MNAPSGFGPPSRIPESEPRSPGPKEVFSFAQIQHLARVEFRRAQRYGYPLVVLELAVDRLEHLRDVFGYELKERVLEEVVALLVRETRSSDLVGRLSDDRLLVLVPHVTPEQAKVLAQRLLVGARTLELRHAGRALEVTLSIGAGWSQGSATLFFDTLIEAASGALADAAAAGGDRYLARSADPEPAP